MIGVLWYLEQQTDQATSVTTNRLGEVYVAGCTGSNKGTPLPFPLKKLGGAYFQYYNTCAATAGGNDDAFIMRFTQQGELVWSTLFGSGLPCLANREFVNEIQCNSKNELIIGGNNYSATSGNFPFVQPGGSYLNSTYNSVNGFLAVFDDKNALKWSSFVPGGEIKGIAIDNEDNIAAVGLDYIGTMGLLSTGNAYSQSFDPSGNGDATLFAFNSNHSLIWSTYFGGNGSDVAYDCDFSQIDNKLYVCGGSGHSQTAPPFTFPFIYPGSGYYDDTFYFNSLGYSTNGWLSSFFDDYLQEWGTLFAGEGEDWIEKIEIGNATNYIFFTGNNYSISTPEFFPLYDPNPYSSVPFYFDDVYIPNKYQPYITMLNAEKDMEWCTYYGSEMTNEFCTDIAANEKFLLWTGTAVSDPTSSSSVPVLAEVLGNSYVQTTTTSNVDGMIAKFNATNPLKISTDGINNLSENSNIFIHLENKNLTISTQNNAIKDFQLFDISGKIVFNKTNLNHSVVICKLPSITKGVYILSINSTNSKEFKKITITN